MTTVRIFYEADAPVTRKLMAKCGELGRQLDSQLPYVEVEVVRAVREEKARTVEDVLTRRARALFLDARAAICMAPARYQYFSQGVG